MRLLQAGPPPAQGNPKKRAEDQGRSWLSETGDGSVTAQDGPAPAEHQKGKLTVEMINEEEAAIGFRRSEESGSYPVCQ